MMVARTAIPIELPTTKRDVVPAEASVTHTDDELVIRARQGDESAFGLLFERHKDLVFRFVANMVRSRDEAEDLVQETFVRAFQNIGGYRDQAKFTTWLLRIATNLATDRIRMTQRRSHLEQQQAKGGLLWMTEGNPEDPNMNLESAETVRILREVILELPEHHRSMIVLRDIEGREYEDIAQMVGTSVGGVKLRVLRARRALRDRMLPRMEEAGL